MLFSGSQKEPLYFVKVAEKGTAQKDLTDPYGHFIGNDERFLKGFYLKLTRSKHIDYIAITEDLYLDAQHFKILIQKANYDM